MQRNKKEKQQRNKKLRNMQTDNQEVNHQPNESEELCCPQCEEVEKGLNNELELFKLKLLAGELVIDKLTCRSSLLFKLKQQLALLYFRRELRKILHEFLRDQLTQLKLCKLRLKAENLVIVKFTCSLHCHIKAKHQLASSNYQMELLKIYKEILQDQLTQLRETDQS
jgi:hypothetical protein